VGPLRAVLHSPELADRWQALGEYLRYLSVVPLPLRELTVIAVGRHWNCQLEWLIHAPIAREAGITERVIDAIRAVRAPEFVDARQTAVYELTRELLASGRASDAIYDEVREHLGTQGIVELVALVGYYSMVALTLNAHQVPLPEATANVASLPLPETEAGQLRELTALPAALRTTVAVR
jgi:4-carboxymuconolactone decarboxylase